ncbi:MAG: hypothetical protein ABIT38_01355, partial [Gemmatimonadaceae bacterium]
GSATRRMPRLDISPRPKRRHPAPGRMPGRGVACLGETVHQPAIDVAAMLYRTGGRQFSPKTLGASASAAYPA